MFFTVNLILDDSRRATKFVASKELKTEFRIAIYFALASAATVCAQTSAPVYAVPQRALIDQYCVGCHNDQAKTGGLSLQNPDLARVVEVYRRERAAGDEYAGDHLFEALAVSDSALDRYPAWFRPVKSFIRTDVHKWLYDEASLSALLREAGFVDIRRLRYLESAIPGIEEVEREGRVVESICLEARKP